MNPWSWSWSLANFLIVAGFVLALRLAVAAVDGFRDALARSRDAGPTAALPLAGPEREVDQVKGRAHGSSEQLHRSGERKHGRSEPLNAPRPEERSGHRAGESFSPLPSDPTASGGMTRAEPLVLREGSLPAGPRQIRCIVWLGERSE